MRDRTRGVVAMIGACVTWGLSPMYYKALQDLPALELFAHRGLWAFVFFAGLLLVQGRLGQVRTALTDPSVGALAVATVMVALNWGLLIWAVLSARATEASLGYFILPLFAVLLGRVLLGERLMPAQVAAVILAVLAVALLTVGLGQLPWISLVLGSTFALYSLLKKRMEIGPVVSVTAETTLILPFMVAILGWYHAGGGGYFGQDWQTSLMLMAAGPLTATPLILYTYAARRVRLSTLGIMQYLNPTLQFFVATMIFAEPFGVWHAVAFPLIWIALLIYSVAALRADRASRRLSRAASAEGAIP